MRYPFNKDLFRKLRPNFDDEDINAIEEELQECFKIFNSLLAADVRLYEISRDKLVEDEDVTTIFQAIFIIQTIYTGVTAKDEKMFSTGINEITDKSSDFYLLNLYKLRRAIMSKYKDKLIGSAKFLQEDFDGDISA